MKWPIAFACVLNLIFWRLYFLSRFYSAFVFLSFVIMMWNFLIFSRVNLWSCLKSIILYQDPNYFLLKEDESPCIFGPIEKQRWSYACAKQLIERLIYGELMIQSCCWEPVIVCWITLHVPIITLLCPFTAEGAENGLEFTIVRPFNWIGPRMDFIPGIDGPSEGVPRVLACFSNVCMFYLLVWDGHL